MRLKSNWETSPIGHLTVPNKTSLKLPPRYQNDPGRSRWNSCFQHIRTKLLNHKGTAETISVNLRNETERQLCSLPSKSTRFRTGNYLVSIVLLSTIVDMDWYRKYPISKTLPQAVNRCWRLSINRTEVLPIVSLTGAWIYSPTPSFISSARPT